MANELVVKHLSCSFRLLSAVWVTVINTVISCIDSAGIGMAVDFIKMGVAVDLDVAITKGHVLWMHVSQNPMKQHETILTKSM